MALQWTLILALLATLAPSPAAAPGSEPPARTALPPQPPPLPDAAATARLGRGEVLLASRVVGPQGLAEETGVGVIDAPPSRVYAALADFAHYREWVPFVKVSDAAPQADGSVLSFQSLVLPFPLGKRYYKIHAHSEAPSAAEAGTPAAVWRVWWTYVPKSGNVVDHYGWWVLQPFAGGRTLGTGLLYTDPGGGPAWALHRGTAETIPYIFSGLRQQIHRSRYDQPLR
jgi:polyketide cyclase/dehydrase/lipid transport protein